MLVRRGSRRRAGRRPASTWRGTSWRGLHVDLARQFLPADDVEWLDRRRRVARPEPVAPAPDRRRGLALPGARLRAPHGRRGVARPRPRRCRRCSGPARRRTAVPTTAPTSPAGTTLAGAGRHRDRARGRPARATASPPSPRCPSSPIPTTRAAPRSVQHFVDNVLNPGVDAHVAVPRGRVRQPRRRLPVAVAAPRRRRGRARGVVGIARRRGAGRRRAALGGAHEIGAAFLREVVALVRRVTGRRVGVWEEGADALEPGDGYAVGVDVRARRAAGSAAAGHDVVAAPATAHVPRHGGRPPTGTSPARAGPGTRRSPTSRRSTRRPAGPAAERERTCSACRRASGPSTSTTARPSNASCSPA